MAEPRARILIVDDAALVRLYYRRILEGAGYQVEEALNGLEALERLLKTLPDVVIVDVNMPQMDGFTFLKALRRQTTEIASIPALVTSPEAGPQDAQAARAAGANFYLVKPVDPQALVEYAALMCGVAP